MTRRPSYLFIMAVVLAGLFACLGLMLALGYIPTVTTRTTGFIVPGL